MKNLDKYVLYTQYYTVQHSPDPTGDHMYVHPYTLAAALTISRCGRNLDRPTDTLTLAFILLVML